MEYEIDDDPQGEDDLAEADRTGGIEEDHADRRRKQASPTRDKCLQPC